MVRRPVLTWIITLNIGSKSIHSPEIRTQGALERDPDSDQALPSSLYDVRPWRPVERHWHAERQFRVIRGHVALDFSNLTPRAMK